MKRKINAGTTSFIDRVFCRDTSVTTKVSGLTALAYNTSGLTLYYCRAGSSSDTSVTLVTATLGTWVTGGLVKVDDTNMPGEVEVHIPNAAIASGVPFVTFRLRGAANMEEISWTYELDAVNYQDATRFGMTALPNAAAGANTGLPVVGTQVPNANAAASGGLPILGTGAGGVHVDGSGNVYAIDQNGNQLASLQAVSSIAAIGAALSTVAASNNITTGTETGTVANTNTLDGNFDTFASVGNAIDVYYQFTLASITGGTGAGVNWAGYVGGAVNTIKVYAYNWGATAWDQIGNIVGIAGSTVSEQDFDITSAHTGTGGNAGLVRIRFAATGLTTGTLNTDRILLQYAVALTPPANWSTMGITAGGVVTANTTQFAGQTITCAGGVTIPSATLASTTNITAGTITTATNLTNLPSIPANWITAAGINAGAIDLPTLTTGLRQTLSGYLNFTGVTTGPVTADNYVAAGFYNGRTYFQSTTLGTQVFVWWNTANWIASTTLGTNGAGYFQSVERDLGGGFILEGTASGTPTVTVGYPGVDTEAWGGDPRGILTDAGGNHVPSTNMLLWQGTTPLALSSSLVQVKVNSIANNAITSGAVNAGALNGKGDWMATYTQPTGFLAATFPAGTIANTTNITAGTMTSVGTLTTYTGNTPQTGDSYPAVSTNLDAKVSLTATASALSAVAVNVIAIVGRITSTLFNGITSLPNWLRALTRKDAPDATALSEINSGGGAYLASTDSLEAIADNETGSGGTTNNYNTTVMPLSGIVPAGTSPAFQGKDVTLAINYPLTQTFDLIGFDATGWSELYWAVKAHPTDVDGAAIIAVKLSNPGSGGDGLVILNGAIPSGGTSASDGSITGVAITTATSTQLAQLAFTVNLTARGTAIPAGGYSWELTIYKSAVKQVWLGTGFLKAKQTLLASPAAP